jgi:hypothetical protein
MGCSPHQQLTEGRTMRILNLTQHPATPEQHAAGVVDLTPAQRVFVSQWLTFEEVPTRRQVKSRAALLAQAAANDSVGVGEVGQFDAAMIGGAPYLMGPLEEALLAQGIKPLYAFSRRESVETIAADGSVTKTNVFRHAGFVGD